MADTERIEEAAEAIADHEERQAEAAEQMADAVQTQALSQATETTVAAAAGAVALANETAAAAELQAAQLLQQQTQENEEWKSRVIHLENSQNELRATVSTVAQNQPTIMEALAGLQTAIQSLTPQNSTPNQETEIAAVNPEAQNPSGGEADHAAPVQQPQAVKRKKRWI